MTNPYDPPIAELTPPVTARDRSFFFGGFGLVALFALMIGGGVGVLITLGTTMQSPFYIWGAPALGWFVALATLVGIMRNSRFSVESALLLALGLVVPAYILYVPVCAVTSVLTYSFFGSGDDGTTPEGVMIGSAFAFLAILLSIAAILRVRCRVPTDRVAPIPGKADDQPPDNEFS